MSPATIPLVDLYAPIADGLSRSMAIFDEELASAVEFVNRLCTRVGSYRGKMLRPALLLLTGEALGGQRQAHHVLAAVVEMVHVATLVHDDVLDGADIRRAEPTVNHMNGNEAAVMLGDYLISHAFHLCSSLDSQEASRLIGRTTNVVCEGELMQIHSRGRFDLTEDEYFEIITRKTAHLTATCCELGARFAGADASAVQSMRRFGRFAGIAFQIMDDVLDLVGSEQQVGKTLGRDMALGKATLPVLHCLRAASPEQRGALIQALGSGSGEARDRVALACRESGSLDAAASVARGYVSQAMECLDALPESAARASLFAMAEFIIRRDH